MRLATLLTVLLGISSSVAISELVRPCAIQRATRSVLGASKSKGMGFLPRLPAKKIEGKGAAPDTAEYKKRRMEIDG
jgi:hypothetical protein